MLFSLAYRTDNPTGNRAKNFRLRTFRFFNRADGVDAYGRPMYQSEQRADEAAVRQTIRASFVSMMAVIL